ncbi:hypothetical protein BH10ACT2_BH10ACT2_18380 [soil metagenome]
MSDADRALFWELIDELQAGDPRIEEGTIMGNRSRLLEKYSENGCLFRVTTNGVGELFFWRESHL